ncbi:MULTISPECIES: hypothetical protein [Halobacillus]|nr:MULTISPECIES: hypothetical protein [Halobacillus]
MKKVLACVGLMAFLAAASLAPGIHDSAEDAYPQPLVVEQV